MISDASPCVVTNSAVLANDSLLFLFIDNYIIKMTKKHYLPLSYERIDIRTNKYDV